ncbi:unnamed protein product [Periconia digitata]|uniref:Uncharacterized protein n=1 Tax=Periconia digitata TaxID=1303443 RepID=A0A9W4U6J3_9PLEO|nr:unnamed protein product [Periconia digitata]
MRPFVLTIRTLFFAVLFITASLAVPAQPKDQPEDQSIDQSIDQSKDQPEDQSKDQPKDQPKGKLVCYSPSSEPKAPPGCYIAQSAMASHVADFCDQVGGLDIANLEKGYATDTYNGAQLRISSTKKVSKEDCASRMGEIVNGCTPAANNPMNWKYGGENSQDETLFKISIDSGRSCQRKANQDGSPLQAVTAKCDSFYQAIRDEFWIYGAGFLGDDFGKELRDQMSHCTGRVVDWTFEYYEKPDADGYEWKAFGHTTIWQKNCFSPVIKGSGGPDIPCNGSG